MSNSSTIVCAPFISIRSTKIRRTRSPTDSATRGTRVFDKSGKYLFFTASTNVGPTISFADLSGIAHQTSRNVYAIVLRNDIPSPLAPESDEEKIAAREKGRAEAVADAVADAGRQLGDAAAAECDAATPNRAPSPTPTPRRRRETAEPTRVDLDGIDQRVIAISQIPTRNYNGLYAGKAGTLYVTEIPQAPQTRPVRSDAHKFDLEKRKFEEVKTGVNNFPRLGKRRKNAFPQGRRGI